MNELLELGRNRTQSTRPEVIAPTRDLESKPFRWTIEQYRQLGDTGLFHDCKTMLIHGELYVMVMPRPPHDVALGQTDDWLRTVFTTGYHVRNQMGFDIGIDNDPGPDLAVVRGKRIDYSKKTPTEAVLIVEIAETSLMIDTTTKAELYATAGVPDYWVIDCEKREIIVFRDPVPLAESLGATAYRQRFVLTETESISPLAVPSVSVVVGELLS